MVFSPGTTDGFRHYLCRSVAVGMAAVDSLASNLLIVLVVMTPSGMAFAVHLVSQQKNDLHHTLHTGGLI